MEKWEKIQNIKTWDIYALDKPRILYYDNATEIKAKSVDEDSRCQQKYAASREGCEPVASNWHGKSLPSCAAERPVSCTGIRRYTDNV